MDLLSIDLADAAIVGQRLSARYADRCRAVEVAAARSDELAGDTDAAYGLRVFVRHYCVHLAGPDPAAALPSCPADARAARGLNGDLGHHLRRWRHSLSSGTEGTDRLGVRVARKTLLAVAGMVSVHDHTWTTDRARAARRWSEIEPELAGRLTSLHRWAHGDQSPPHEEVRRALGAEGIIPAVVERFSRLIGLWPDAS
ncbi:hypothetical protein AB6N24_08025 [Cellulomonas sp. 179-A 4D5 NHS]|uniref:hypothetical protein n=1 Tax=Cellulomonas sp. 179-A 4D5 NHS TaxID=3142378 RepID=UPI00399EF0C7